MDRQGAYSVLARELERFRRLPWPDLVRHADGPPIETTEWDGTEALTVEVQVEWAEGDARSLRIRATSYGPSCWRLERHEETLLVRPPGSME